MRIFSLFISFLLISLTLNAQDKGFITITSEGSVDLPADIIRFNINLNAEADTPQEAYDLHKKREKVLVQLLDRYNIEEEQINFEPVRLSKMQPGGRYSNEEPSYQTRQAVIVKLTDFESYEQIQVTLVEENFDSFSGDFLSSKEESGNDRALQKAIRAAKQKAEIIANEAGVTLGSIVGIDYSYNRMQPRYSGVNEMAITSSAQNQLMKYDQVVTIYANITMKFQIMR